MKRYAVMISAAALLATAQAEVDAADAPVFGTPAAIALTRSIIFSVPLDPGAGLLWVKCWVSDDQASLGTGSPAQEWDAEIPATLVHTVAGLSESTTRYAQFEACYLPDGDEAEITVWSAIISAITSNRELVWDNGAPTAEKNIWNLTSKNWHVDGSANATAIFVNGNSARFPGNASRNLTLAEPVTVDNVSVDISGGDNNVNYWALSGAKPLSLYGVFTIRDSNNNVNNRIDEPVLLGPGNVRLESGRFRLGNSANQFTGGVNILAGQLDATVTGANASPLGSGSVALGSAVISAVSSATLSLNAANAAAIHLPALTLDGAMNAAKLVLTGVGPLDASFGNFDRAPGATLQVNATANSTLSIANIGADGLLPPWVAATSGHYMQNNDGVLSAITDYAGYGIFTGSSLTASTNVTAARLTANLTLGRNTLSLGGAIRGHNITVSGGTLDLTGNNAYLYVPSGAATLSTLFSGDGLLTKFGAGRLALTQPVVRDMLIQEGALTLTPALTDTISSIFTGSGTLEVGAGKTVTLTSTDSIINTLSLPNTATLVLDGGKIKTLANGVLASGSSLVITNGGRFTNGGATFYAGAGNADNHVTVTGESSVFDLNNTALYIGVNNGSALRNHLVVTDSAVITNATMISLGDGQGGSYNTITANRGAQVHTASTRVGRMGSYTSLTITDPGTIWDNGGGSIEIGWSNGGATPTANYLVISNQALLRNVGNINLSNKTNAGDNGKNFIFLNTGAQLFSNGTVSIPYAENQNNTTYDNLMRVSDPGTLWDLGRGILRVGNAYRGYTRNNFLIIDNQATVQNAGEVQVAYSHARTGRDNHFVITNAATFTSFGAVRVGYPYSGSDNNTGAESNTVTVVGGPAGISRWNMNNQALTIGQAAKDTAFAHGNTFTVAPDSVVESVAAISVGVDSNNGKRLNRGNALRLAGGDISAASLTVHPANCLDLVVGSSGIKPLIVTGNATLSPGSVIRPFCSDESKAGSYYPVIQSSGVITTNGVVFNPTQRNFVFKLMLSENKKELALGVFPQGTLLILK